MSHEVGIRCTSALYTTGLELNWCLFGIKNVLPYDILAIHKQYLHLHAALCRNTHMA